MAAHYQFHANLVAHWKKQLLEGAATVFTKYGKNAPSPDDPKVANRTSTSGGYKWSSPS